MIFDGSCFRHDAVNLFCNAFGDCERLAGPFLLALSWNTVKSAKKATQRPTIAVVLKYDCRKIGTAGFRRRGRDAPVVTSLTWKFLVPTRLPACSRVVEDLDSPQHDDDGRYQRGHRQYTL
jgi:hypothetical protein